MWKVARSARGEAQGLDSALGEGGGRRNEEAGPGQSFAVSCHPGGHIERHQTLHCDPLVTVLKLQPLGKVVQVSLK